MKVPSLICFVATVCLAIAPALSAADLPPVLVSGFKGNINGARFTPDGRTLILAGAMGIFFVDPATGKVVRAVELTKSIESFVLSPDGTLGAGGQSDGTIVIYSMADGSVRTTIVAQEFCADSSPTLAGFMPDGKSLVGGAKNAGIWSVADGKLLKTITFPQPLHRLSLSPDGKWLLAVSRHGGPLAIYDLAAGKLAAHQPETKQSTPKDLEPNPTMVNDLGFSPDGKRFYAGGFMSHGLFLYTTADGRQAGRLKLNGYQNGSFSKDMVRLAWGSWNTQPGAKNEITVTDVKTTAPVKQFPANGVTNFCVLSPDGNTLFVLPNGGGPLLYSLGARGAVR